MGIEEVRKRFLKCMEASGHSVIASASVVPTDDATTLFTGSGMQPLVPYLLGKDHQMGKRLADSQKCFRANDIDEVGDNRHTTFFEMLGNWSLGRLFQGGADRAAVFLFSPTPMRVSVSIRSGCS